MIYNFDPRYTIAQLFVNTALRLNFRKMVFVGKKENMSKKRPVILAPNHRNALLDALLLVYASYLTKQVVFLARADIFKKKFIAWILRGMRILPVYRIRDGKDNLGKNTEIFNNCGRVLKKNNPIALFPEARGNPKQSLLPVQKAVPRIVLPTEAQFDFSLNSQIVPVGIYYRDMQDLLSDVYVRFGKPIEVSKYKDDYAENPITAVNHLRDELEKELKSVVVNIWNDAFYDDYQCLIDANAERIANEMFADKKDGFVLAAQHIVLTMDDWYINNRSAFDTKIADVYQAQEVLKKHRLTSTDDIANPKPKSCLMTRYILLLLTAPIAAFGYLNSIFSVLISRKLCGMFKDKQFVPSVRYAVGLLCVPLFAIIQSVVLGLLTNWVLALVYFIVVPVTFYFRLWWRRWWKKAGRDWKVQQFAKDDASDWKQVVKWLKM